MPTFKRYKKKRRTRKEKNRRKNISYKRRKNKRRTRKKKMKGGGRWTRTGRKGNYQYWFHPDTQLLQRNQYGPFNQQQLVDVFGAPSNTNMADNNFQKMYNSLVSEDRSKRREQREVAQAQAQAKAMAQAMAQAQAKAQASQGSGSGGSVSSVSSGSGSSVSSSVSSSSVSSSSVSSGSGGGGSGFPLTSEKINAGIGRGQCKLILQIELSSGGQALISAIGTAIPHHIGPSSETDVLEPITFITRPLSDGTIEVTPSTDDDGPEGGYESVIINVTSLHYLLLCTNSKGEQHYLNSSIPFLAVTENKMGTPIIKQNGFTGGTSWVKWTTTTPPFTVKELKQYLTMQQGSVPGNWITLPYHTLSFSLVETSTEKKAREDMIAQGGKAMLQEQLRHQVTLDQSQDAEGKAILIPAAQQLRAKIAALQKTISDTTEQIGLRNPIPSRTVCTVEHVCSPFLIRYFEDGDGIHDTTSEARCPPGRKDEIIKIKLAFSINQTASLMYGLHEMLQPARLAALITQMETPSRLSIDKSLALRSCYQLLRCAVINNKRKISAATDPMVKRTFKLCLADKDCLTTMLTACPRAWNPIDGKAGGIVLIHLFPHKENQDSVIQDEIIRFYQLQRYGVRNKTSKSGGNSWLNGHVGVVQPPALAAMVVGEHERVFNRIRWKIMSLISRFPEGALFYGPVMSGALVNATREYNDLSKIKPPLPADNQFGNFATAPGIREPIAFSSSPPESYICVTVTPETNSLLDSLCDILKINYRYDFLKALITGGLADQEELPCYQSPIPMTLGIHGGQVSFSIDTVFIALGVKGWTKAGVDIFSSTQTDFITIIPIIEKMKQNLAQFLSQAAARIKTAVVSALAKATASNKLLLQQRITTLKDKIDAKLDNDVTGLVDEMIVQNIFVTLRFNPFWQFILDAMQVAGPMNPALVNSPKNLITDQLPSANISQACTTALANCGISEGIQCFAYRSLDDSRSSLAVLQAARYADHAPGSMAGARSTRLMQTMQISLGQGHLVYRKLLSEAQGNPLYAQHVSTFKQPSTGWLQPRPITVTQVRPSYNLSQEQNVGILFGEEFYDRINLNKCGATCSPCSSRSSEELLQTCIPKMTSCRGIGGQNPRCEFTADNLSAASCPLFKFNNKQQYVEESGAAGRLKTCMCDCYQEEYYDERGPLQGQWKTYSDERQSKCPSCFTPSAAAKAPPFLSLGPDNPYESDKALYDFVSQAKLKVGTTLKYKLVGNGGRFSPSHAVCTGSCHCQGFCLGNSRRAQTALWSLSDVAKTQPNSTFWVRDYIRDYPPNSATNMYCLMRFIYKGINVSVGGLPQSQLSISSISEMLRRLLQPQLLKAWSETPLGEDVKKTGGSLTWSFIISHIINSQLSYSGMALANATISVPVVQQGQPFAQQVAIYTFISATIFQSGLLHKDHQWTLEGQTLILNYVINNLVLSGRTSYVSMNTGYTTGSTVLVTTGSVTLNSPPNGATQGQTSSVSSQGGSQHESRSYDQTTAVEAGAGVMDALTNARSYQEEPLTGWGSNGNLTPTQLSKLASLRGKESGDRSLQETAFCGDAICLTGDLPSQMTTGLIRSMRVRCNNGSQISKRMNASVKYKGDNTYQVFVRGGSDNFGVQRPPTMAIQVLQVAPPDAALMNQLPALAQHAHTQCAARLKTLKKLVGKSGKVKKKEAKQIGLM